MTSFDSYSIETLVGATTYTLSRCQVDKDFKRRVIVQAVEKGYHILVENVLSSGIECDFGDDKMRHPRSIAYQMEDARMTALLLRHDIKHDSYMSWIHSLTVHENMTIPDLSAGVLEAVYKSGKVDIENKFFIEIADIPLDIAGRPLFWAYVYDSGPVIDTLLEMGSPDLTEEEKKVLPEAIKDAKYCGAWESGSEDDGMDDA